jgi:hypothetical protein
MEKELPGLSYLNAAFNSFTELRRTLLTRVLRDHRSQLILLILTIAAWQLLEHLPAKHPIKPQLILETDLTVEPKCQNVERIIGFLISEKDDPCILISKADLLCPERIITIKASDLKQIPFQQLKRLNKIKFSERSPIGVSLCKNVRKISFESW